MLHKKNVTEFVKCAHESVSPNRDKTIDYFRRFLKVYVPGVKEIVSE